MYLENVRNIDQRQFHSTPRAQNCLATPLCLHVLVSCFASKMFSNVLKMPHVVSTIENSRTVYIT